jgi:hypothetical protein
MSQMLPFDSSDYSVVVKSRAPLPNAWRWEIYRAGRASPMEFSSVFFCTVSAALRAGKAALKRLMAKSFPEHIPASRSGDSFDIIKFCKRSSDICDLRQKSTAEKTKDFEHEARARDTAKSHS